MIRQVHVRNFKSLKDVSLTLGRRNFLVGPNMAGKSNLLSVFKFLRQMVYPAQGVSGLLGAMTALGGLGEIRWLGGESDLISIALEVDAAGGETWEYRIDILGNRQGSVTVQDEVLAVSDSAGRHELISRDPTSGGRELKHLDGRSISAVYADRSGLEFEIPDWHGDAFRRYVGRFAFYSLLPPLLKQINPTSAIRILEEGGGNLSAWLMLLQTRHPESFQRIVSAARSVLPGLASLWTVPTEQSTVFLSSKEHALKRDIPVWQMSDGELCVVALLSLIFAPPEMASLHCVEEMENYLHPRLMETVVELLRQRQEELGAEAGQVLATTHSLALIDRLDPDELIVVEKREGATICTRPSDKSHLRGLLEEAGLGELYYSGALSGG